MPTSAQPYQVDTQKAILAVSLDDLNDNKVSDIFTVVKPVFFTATRDHEGKWFNKRFYEAVPCEQIFSEELLESTTSLKATL